MNRAARTESPNGLTFQKRGPHSLCVCASLRRASRAICHLYDLVLAPAGIKTTQYILLHAIFEAGEFAHCDLARDFAAAEETLSRRLASARKAGWVRMTVDARHRRMYQLTKEGRVILEIATPYWERAQLRMRRELGELDWDIVGAFAERVTQAAIRAETTPLPNSRPKPTN